MSDIIHIFTDMIHEWVEIFNMLWFFTYPILIIFLLLVIIFYFTTGYKCPKCGKRSSDKDKIKTIGVVGNIRTIEHFIFILS